MSDLFVLKRNATGTVLEAFLEDANGPVDLSSYQSVSLTLKQENQEPAILDGLCVIDPNQTANRGKVSYSFIATSTIPAGFYNGEFTARDSNGLDHKFPVNSKKKYSTFEVQESLS